MSAFLPWSPEASAFAHRSDVLLAAVSGLTGAVALAIIVLIVVFAVRYRQGVPAERARHPLSRSQHIIEVSWIVGPLLLFLATFVWAAKLYFDEHNAPADALQVFVVAKQWMWKVQHADGRREINQLHVPRGVPVKLIMTSQDAIHSFFVPAFRIKQDVLPGRYTMLWFNADRAGDYHLFCAEYCGTDHSRMVGRVIVMDPADYERWLASGTAEASASAVGEGLFRTLGCSGCHDSAAATVHAPSLAGLYGRQVALSSGATVTADERYIRDSILVPAKDVAAGFAPIMPSYTGQVTEEQILALIAYIESLPGRKGAAP